VAAWQWIFACGSKVLYVLVLPFFALRAKNRQQEGSSNRSAEG
jgi:hypothetical protein